MMSKILVLGFIYSIRAQFLYSSDLPTSNPIQTQVSPDGSMLMKSNPNGFGLYSKSGASYSVYTSSSHGATMKKLYMTPSSTETIITCSDKIKYNSRSGTTYTLETTINAAPSTQFLLAKITNSLNHIITSSSNGEVVDIFNGNSNTIAAQTGSGINDFSFTSDETMLVTGGDDQIVRIYTSDGNSVFAYSHEVLLSISITKIHITDDKKYIFVGGLSTTIFILEQVGSAFSITSSFTFSSNSQVEQMKVMDNYQVIVLSGQSLKIDVFKLNYNTSEYESLQIIAQSSTFVSDIDMISDGSILFITSNQTGVLIYEACSILNCWQCSSDLTTCLKCNEGYEISSGTCIVNNDPAVNSTTNSTLNSTINSTANSTTNATTDSTTNSTANSTTNTTTNTNSTTNQTTTNQTSNSTNNNKNNINQFIPLNCFKQSQGICIEYCPSECATCDSERKCLTCSNFYKMENNECIIESKLLEAAVIINSLLSSLRLRRLKCLLFAVDNFWLYEYHKENYTWLTSTIFGTIRFVQSKKSQIIDSDSLPFIQDSIVPTFPNYFPYSNEKYIKVQGKDSFFFRSTIEYFIMVIPYCLILFILCNRVFYCLFDKEISQILRIFSFWGFLFQMGIQSNIQFFTFLAFRNFHTMFSFNFTNKVYLAVMIFFVYFVVLFAVAGYFLLYYFYGKLAKYFLDNVFRVKGSFFMMSFIYCLRPFLKGVIHSQLYDNNTIQLALLMSIQFLTCVIIIVSEIRNKIFMFKSVLLLDLCFYFCLGFFNVLLLFSRSITMTDSRASQIDHYLQIIGYIMIVTMLFRFILNIVLCKSILDEDIMKELEGDNKAKVKFLNSKEEKKMYMEERGINYQTNVQKKNQQTIKVFPDNPNFRRNNKKPIKNQSSKNNKKQTKTIDNENSKYKQELHEMFRNKN